MEIHGNAFTVWSVRGTEYQSSVSSGDCPFRLLYLKDRNRTVGPHRLTECQHYKATGLRLHCLLSAVKVNLGKKWIRSPPSPTHLLKPPECILFIFNFALFSTNSDPKLNKVKCIFLSVFFFEEGVLTFQWLLYADTRYAVAKDVSLHYAAEAS